MDLKLSFFPLFFCVLVFAMLIGQTFAFTNKDVKVGIYVYTWYNPDDSTSWEYPKIVDKPVLNYYNSCDPTVIATQIRQIEDLGIDFVMLNWLGIDGFSDTVVGQWYEVAKTNATRLKLSIMVEPYNETTDGYNYTEIYERAYSLYDNYKGHSLLYEDYLGVRPVIFFYNGAYLTGDIELTLPKDDRFQVMTVGHRKYVDFWYDDIRNYIPEHTPQGSYISVLPRFDDFWQWKLGLRDHVDVIDRYLTEGLYESQWKRAVNYADKNMVRWIGIATWNEYPERTAIEPHYDNTAYNTDPYYLYNLTKTWIEHLHGINPYAEKTVYWYQNPLVYGLVMLGLALGVFILWKW